MVNYQNGKIYKIVNNIDDEIYVGSTCLPLSQRKAIHKCTSTKYPDMTIYKHLNNVGWDNVMFILIEKFPCNDKMELLQRERYWFDLLIPKLNKNGPIRTPQEAKDQLNEQNNKNSSIYYASHKDKFKSYYISHKDQIKAYQEANKEQIAIKKKQYYEAIKVIINCECGKTYLQRNKARHLITNKHTSYIQKQAELAAENL